MSEHNEFVCCVPGCGGLICLTPEQERKLRRTHELFKCPFGHSQHFAGQTDEEKRIARLERDLDETRAWRSQLYDDLESVAKHARACPLGCGWRSRRRPVLVWGLAHYSGERRAQLRRWAEYFGRLDWDMVEHLHREHGCEHPAEVEQVAA